MSFPPPPCSIQANASLLFITSLFFLLLPLQLISQPPEPDDFDWRESFGQTTKTEFNYDPQLIDELSDKAMFYVMVRPREESKEITKINRDGKIIYERYKTNYYKISGDDFNYGLGVMINTNGESHYSLISNPNSFQENENSHLVNFNYDVGTLEETSLDPKQFRLNLEESDMPRFTIDGKEFFRNLDANIDISFPNDETVFIVNLATGQRKLETYTKVHDNIFRITQSITYLPLESVEGYCYEKKVTTSYEDYVIQSSTIENRSSNLKDSPELIVNQTDGGILRFEQTGFETEGTSIQIFDILGRPMTNGTIKGQSFIFNPKVAGTYIVVISDGQNQISKKVFLN